MMAGLQHPPAVQCLQEGLAAGMTGGDQGQKARRGGEEEAKARVAHLQERPQGHPLEHLLEHPRGDRRGHHRGRAGGEWAAWTDRR